ncbi:protein-methionine-sulfoxide reductase heme-binding subunit MsrQ [Prosthecobacter vanneervenii]|uniref:Protein-methionine-sulfoxide reductase heme-binding subunit MsrQ n=1 Tax=Prosthecobacter vanneervenii TaxID=48466 RepID=A0A7W7YCA9_9BACT|nr:protein-methionine-sulfoxide reductase heme-binding subunit MsrQ [Prosthecobacter vanneervenii]MBB5033387.1 sulfoxide reductase heme-binding subunit YedZ [Prosthecobacter vanneervenii]
MKLSADTSFHRQLFFFNGLLPALLILIDGWRGRLGTNPAEFITRTTGVLTLVFLMLTLMVTPLRKLCGWNWLLKQRRLLGLYAFFYGLGHLITYLAYDRDWQLQTVVGDVYKRPFIALGMFSFLLMVPLAVTSTNAMIKKLGGQRWAQLHRLTYYIAIGGVLHYWAIVKSDVTWPRFFAVILALLLGYRVVEGMKKARSAAAPRAS